MNLERYRVDMSSGSKNRISAHDGRPRTFARFIKGPLDVAWLAVAAGLGGKTLHVALALRFAVGLNRTMTVPLTQALRGTFHVGPEAAREALQRLESRGLVSVERRPGCAPRVTIVELEPEANNADRAVNSESTILGMQNQT